MQIKIFFNKRSFLSGDINEISSGKDINCLIPFSRARSPLFQNFSFHRSFKWVLRCDADFQNVEGIRECRQFSIPSFYITDPA
jgi:hypothetical protein